MLSIKVSPFAKAVVAALVALITLIAQCIANGVVDSSSLITFIGSVSGVYGVYKTANKPSPNKTGSIN